MVESDRKMKARKKRKQTAASDRTINILLAEDDLEMRRLLSWSLERKGYKVTECNDGIILMKKLGLLGPGNGVKSCDLIISDIRMPGATALQVLEIVREFSDFPPMILITAFPDAESQELAMRLGAAAMMAKPFDVEELIEKVEETIPRQSEKQRQPGAWPATEGTLPFPFDITLRHDSGSQAVKDYIRNIAVKLRPFSDHVTNGRIIVDQSDREHHKKHHYTVTLVLSTSGKSIAVKHISDSGPDSENLYMAINVAFGIVLRKLNQYIEKRQAYRKQVRRPMQCLDVDVQDNNELLDSNDK